MVKLYKLVNGKPHSADFRSSDINRLLKMGWKKKPVKLSVKKNNP